MNYQKELVIAKQAAETAGKYLLRQFYNSKNQSVAYKKHHEIVTEADTRADEIITKILKKNFSTHEILSEELAPKTKKSAKHLWIVDPLDGTNNFSHGIQIFAVCIAYVEDGDVKIGVVYIPASSEMIWAVKGVGAHKNGKKIFVSATKKIKDSFLLQCHGYSMENKKKDNEIVGALKLASVGTRRLGAAGFELTSVAKGDVDGGYIVGTRPWDSASGAIIVREAGGRVTNFVGDDWTIYDSDILFSNGLIHKELLKFVK